MPAHQPFLVTSTRIGRTDLGPGTVSADDEAIVVAVQAPADDRTILVPCSAVDEVSLDGDEVLVKLHDGMCLSLVGADAPAIRAALIDRCRAMPEVTRALRAFGSRRGHGSDRMSGPDEQRRFFAPLLAARRESMEAADAEAMLAAFRPDVLEEAIAGVLRTFAAERYAANPPARRALDAELAELAEPLASALDALGRAASDASVSVDDLRLWRRWSVQVRETFATADRVWLAADAALDSPPWSA